MLASSDYLRLCNYFGYYSIITTRSCNNKYCVRLFVGYFPSYNWDIYCNKQSVHDEIVIVLYSMFYI
jgi:hypothetical protein